MLLPSSLRHLAVSLWQNLPEEVGWCLPPSACLLYLQYSSGLVKMPADSPVLPFLFSSFALSLSFFPLMTGMDGFSLYLFFHLNFFFPVCAMSCTTNVVNTTSNSFLSRVHNVTEQEDHFGCEQSRWSKFPNKLSHISMRTEKYCFTLYFFGWDIGLLMKMSWTDSRVSAL